MSKAQYDALNEDFAAVCYEEGLPFSFIRISCNEMSASLIESLLQTTFETQNRWPPPWQSLFQTKDKVEEYLDSLSELNVITDESSNINKDRKSVV